MRQRRICAPLSRARLSTRSQRRSSNQAPGEPPGVENRKRLRLLGALDQSRFESPIQSEGRGLAMAQDYVRYSADVETIPAGESDTIEQILASMHRLPTSRRCRSRMPYRVAGRREPVSNRRAPSPPKAGRLQPGPPGSSSTACRSACRTASWPIARRARSCGLGCGLIPRCRACAGRPTALCSLNRFRSPRFRPSVAKPFPDTPARSIDERSMTT